MTTAPKGTPNALAKGTRGIGLIGLGIMGSAMAGNLIAAGFDIVGYDPRSTQRRDLAADQRSGVARRME